MKNVQYKLQWNFVLTNTDCTFCRIVIKKKNISVRFLGTTAMTASMYNMYDTQYIKCILTLNEQLPNYKNNEHTPNTSISHSRIYKYFFTKTIVYHHYRRCHYLPMNLCRKKIWFYERKWRKIDWKS